ncbi:MAG: SRPBCC domain-containing protein [Gemmatimonadota bacterium]
MTPNAMPFTLDRTVLIAATPEIVFRFFTDSARWASWWGAGSTVDARPSGKVFMRHRDGTESGGAIVEVKAGARIVFTYGYASGKPIPMGSSRVTITLAPDKAGTRLRLHHELPDEAVRDEHVQGWRFQLSLFANVVTDEVNADADTTADTWFDTWADPDAARREATLRRIASESVRFQDRFSNLDGLSDLLPHIAAAQHFMPGIRLHRAGSTRHCQGMALCGWVMQGADGKEYGRGTNTFVFGPTGRIEWVTGFWSPPAAG